MSDKRFIFPKTYIFVRMFIPLMFVMFIQAGIIVAALFTSGTTNDLNNNAVRMLETNVQTRGENLESLMVHYWSNISRFELDVEEAIDAFLTEHGITLDEFLGNRDREIELISNLAPSLISMLRATASTGAFMYFLCPGGFREDVHRLNGLYIRDFSPATQVHANLLFIRGYVDIARRYNIPHGGEWEEYFTFDPSKSNTWRGFAYPQLAAALYPNAHSANLSFWNGPHHLTPDEPANAHITYTRPVRFGGRVVAIIGTEVQVTHLERLFPQRDLDYFEGSGYMLFRYDSASSERVGDVFSITGAYMRRLLGGLDEVTIVGSAREHLQLIAEEPEVHLVYFSMHLYNDASPFSGHRWVLAAMGTERAIFEITRRVTTVIIVGSAVACLLGGLFLFVTLRTVTSPVRSITNQLEKSKGDSLITHDSNTYEIELLADTINDITRRRLHAEAQIREERQRYLMALESTTDTLIEYDIAKDTLSMFYFTKERNQELERKVFKDFDEMKHDLIHPEDRYNLFTAENNIIRAKASAFDHVRNVEPADGYYWFAIRSIVFKDEAGNPLKIIGTARECTREKQQELYAIETSRLDPATRFFNLEIGLARVRTALIAERDQPYALHYVQIINFDHMELTYGLFFGAIFISNFANAISNLMENGFGVRINNDSFLIFDEGHNTITTAQIEEAFFELYNGEKADLALGLVVDNYKDNPRPLTDDSWAEYPISITVNPMERGNIENLTMELLERTPDVNSSIRILLGLIGRMFKLDKITIFTYDTGFGTDQTVHEWSRSGITQKSVAKIPPGEFSQFMSMLSAKNTLVLSGETKADDDLRVLLGLAPGEQKGVFCSTINEDAAHIWRVLFISNDANRDWHPHDQDTLHSIVKIITAHMNIEKSRSASRAKSRFLSRISHEIRTPMNAIIGMANIAISAAKDDNHVRVDDCLDKIDVAAKYLLALINDVLEMSRIESGRLVKIEVKPFSLGKFVSEIEAIIRFSIESNQIVFDIISDFAHDKVVADEYRLKQVLINLLGNASKFTNPGGRVVFSICETESSDSWTKLHFSVQDNGIGIPPEMHSSVFNPFEQAETGLPHSQQGTGLGLSISRNIISAMDSSIELKSEAGKGSEFSFTLHLPLADETEEIGSPPPPDERETQFGGKRVLIVDDVDINIEIVEYLMESLGFVTESALNGLEALNKYVAAPDHYYDVVLMDIQMPVMDGIEAARAIRGSTAKSDSQTIPIIALTANAFDNDSKLSAESGMNEHISKPINNNQLLEILIQLLK